ncbi:MAG: hypothetical protein KDI79_18050 [Anaerolineae bacterium]|nr:hypothetical protein [Anaerolineae bacterium]
MFVFNQEGSWTLLKNVVYPLLLITVICGSSVPNAIAVEPTLFSNCRLGVGGAYDNAIGYDLNQLNIGRYVDWRTNANPHNSGGVGLPANVQYLQMVRVKQKKVGGWDSPYVSPPAYNFSPSAAQMATIATASPGSIWLIGNEIERVDWSTGQQDEITPELYATAFHEIQALIKTADPTAQVAIGGVILGTPLRLIYLDQVWTSYKAQFGYSMGQEIDIWNVHGFILPEVKGAWGMDIPAGLETPADYLPQEGLFYSKGLLGDPSVPNNNVDYYTARDKQADIALFANYLKAFRVWMAAKGERNKPLLNTEYGLLNDFYGYYDEQDAVNFMHETFDYMFSATDASVGYPLDENRLVQGWFWYSLNSEWFPLGQLYNSTNKQLTVVGQGWENYVTDPGHPMASVPQVNLLVANLKATPNPAPTQPAQQATVTLSVDIANSGNVKTDTNNTIAVEFWNGPPNTSGSTKIGQTQLVEDIGGCGDFITVSVTWSGLSTGQYKWFVKATPLNGETATTDNTASSSLIVRGQSPEANNSWLPVLIK